jgi:hypothetical protein
MIHVSEFQRSELDPKFFSESWVILIHFMGKVCCKETRCPLTHDILTRAMMMSKEIVR